MEAFCIFFNYTILFSFKYKKIINLRNVSKEEEIGKILMKIY